MVEIKREPERNHLSCVTVKTDYSEVSSVKMELHRNIEEFQRTPAYAGADLRGSRHVSLRRVPWNPGPGLPPPLLSTHFITCYTRTILRYMATTEGRTNNYGKYVSIDIVYLTLQDLKKKHVYAYCLSTVYRVGAQYKLESWSVFLSEMTQNVRKASFRLPKVCFCSWLELIF